MWDGLFVLLSFGFVMAIASFLAGSLPLSFGLSQNHSRTISAIGTGLLVGSCLIIIIPEGIETLYSAMAHDPHAHRVRDAHDEEQHDGGATLGEPHAWVGFALIVGFVTMFLIEQLPKHAAAQAQPKPLHISLANLSQGPHRTSADGGEGGVGEEYGGASGSAKGSSTTIGLVIHAAADGVALAASSFISQSTTGFIVFLALMIHKAPAAFGLTSVLLKQGLTKRQARAHLVVFSLAAPVGALLTWIAVNLVAGGHIQGEQGTRFVTGLLLLFSGGTFLYVAMHTMQEMEVEIAPSPDNGYIDGSVYNQDRKLRENVSGLRLTLLTVAGMLLPLLAQAGHSH